MVNLLRALSIAGVLAILLSIHGLPVAAQTGNGDDAQARLLKEARERAKKAEELTIALTAELKRLQAEVGLLEGILNRRDKEILKLTKDSQELRERALAAEIQVREALLRMQNLLKQLQEREVKLMQPRPEIEFNPPTGHLKGTILKINSKDKTLVEISLGKDHGLSTGHTLEVYRLKPRPEYLGRLRVLAVQERSASALLLKSAVQHSDLKAGDQVANTLPH